VGLKEMTSHLNKKLKLWKDGNNKTKTKLNYLIKSLKVWISGRFRLKKWERPLMLPLNKQKN
jgi:hypothetical protein